MDNEFLSLLAVLSFPCKIVPHQADLQRTSLPQCSIRVLALSCPVGPVHCLEVARTIDNILFTVRWDKTGHWEWGDNQETGWLWTLHLLRSTLQLCSEISQRQMQRADSFLRMLLQKSSYGAYLVLKSQKICWNNLFSAVRLQHDVFPVMTEGQDDPFWGSSCLQCAITIVTQILSTTDERLMGFYVRYFDVQTETVGISLSCQWLHMRSLIFTLILIDRTSIIEPHTVLQFGDAKTEAIVAL